MTAYQKLLFALDDSSEAAAEEFADWARKAGAHDGVGRAEVEHLDEAAQSAHTPKAVRFFAFASLWIEPHRLHDIRATAPAHTQWFTVRERLAFDRSARPDEARRWAGVKKTTPWAAVAAVEPHMWQARYTNHGEIAKAYHATCVRYRQNVVLDGSDPAIEAVSELWWTNVEDLVERFYFSEDAERLLAVDTMGFVDTARAYPTVTQHEVLRVGDAVTGTAGFLPTAD